MEQKFPSDPINSRRGKFWETAVKMRHLTISHYVDHWLIKDKIYFFLIKSLLARKYINNSKRKRRENKAIIKEATIYIQTIN